MSEKREIKRNEKQRSNPFTADLVVKTKDKRSPSTVSHHKDVKTSKPIVVVIS